MVQFPWLIEAYVSILVSLAVLHLIVFFPAFASVCMEEHQRVLN